MDIKYKNDKVKKYCTDYKTAKKVFGEYAKDVIAKINLFESMTSFKDLCAHRPSHCHILNGNLKNLWSVDVKGRKCSLRILLMPIDEAGRAIKSDSDFASVYCSLHIIEIEEVSNHYE